MCVMLGADLLTELTFEGRVARALGFFRDVDRRRDAS